MNRYFEIEILLESNDIGDAFELRPDEDGRFIIMGELEPGLVNNLLQNEVPTETREFGSMKLSGNPVGIACLVKYYKI